MQKDPRLGLKVAEHLHKLGIETPMSTTVHDHNMIDLCTAMMEVIGLDLQDDSLSETPRRLAKMYEQEIFYGLDYANFPCCTTIDNKMKYKELIICDDMEVASVCEHHLLAFIGRAAIGYIPDKKVLGLSKFNRICDFFCRRPQVQERLTEQISATLRFILGTDDVAVVIRADHSCVRLRGVKDSHSSTLTSRMAGKFLGEPAWASNALREEFLRLAKV